MNITSDQLIRQLTDIIYRGLFNMDAAALRVHFNLPPNDDIDDNDIRDCMGVQALEVLALVEDHLGDIIKHTHSIEEMRYVTRYFAIEAGKMAREESEKANLDFLTGKRTAP